MKQIRSVVIDDEQSNTDLLVHFIRKYCPQLAVVGTAKTIEAAKELIEVEKPQLGFLDIKLNKGTGFDLLDQLNEASFNIIFVTAFNEFAIKAFKYNTIDFLLKPIQIEDLILAVESARTKIIGDIFETQRELTKMKTALKMATIQNMFLEVPTVVNKADFVKISEIIYLIADGRYTQVRTVGGPELTSVKQMGELAKELESGLFCRVHSKYLVNLMHVKGIHGSLGKYCLMSDGAQIPISKRKHSDLTAALRLLK
jgi:two-component system, LytTR family, response regulator